MTTSLALLLALAAATAPATPPPAAAPTADTGILVPAQVPAPALAECTPDAIAAAEHPRLREGRCRRELREAVETGVTHVAPQACEPIAGQQGVQCIPVRGVRTSPTLREVGSTPRLRGND